MKKEKVYRAEFMEYTGYTKSTVAKYGAKYGPDKIKDAEYLDVGSEPFLVKESDIDKYKDFGGGYKVLTFVGFIEV